MPRPSRARKAARPALVAAAVVLHHLIRTGDPAAVGCDAGDDALVLLSWNLENFPGDHDLAKMAARIAAADADVIAVQEVLEPDALTTLASELTPRISSRGGARGQRLGLLFDDERDTASDLVEHPLFEMGGRVRPAVSSHVQHGDLDFHLVVVHLKATPSGLATRRLQWAALADLVLRLPLSGPGIGDRDIVIVGDFNTTGAGDLDAQGEREALAAVLATAGVRPIEPSGGCSAYWDGVRRDGWLEPSLLDLVFVGGLHDLTIETEALGACRRHRCKPVRSTAAHPDPDIVGSSDHCPVRVRFSR